MYVCTVHMTILHWQENPMCTYNIFHLQFHNVIYFLSINLYSNSAEYYVIEDYENYISKSAILIFWAIAGFRRKSYVVHTTILHKQENAKCRHKWRIRLYCTDTTKYDFFWIAILHPYSAQIQLQKVNNFELLTQLVHFDMLSHISSA